MKQGLHEQSAVKIYPLGMPYKSNNQLYRYSHAEAALAGLARLVINSCYAPGVTGHEDVDGYEGDLYADAPIGQIYVDIADTAGRAENFYQGGHLIIFSSTIFHQHYIVKSEAGTGSYVRCWLSKPIVAEAAEVGDGVTAYRSPYSDVAVAGSVQAGFEPFIGINLRPVTIDYYFWLLTAGLVWVTATGVVWPGAAAHQRDVYANPNDGTINVASQQDPTTGYQKVGWLSTATGGTSSDYGDALIMLQLDQ